MHERTRTLLRVPLQQLVTHTLLVNIAGANCGSTCHQLALSAGRNAKFQSSLARTSCDVLEAAASILSLDSSHIRRAVVVLCTRVQQ